MQLASLLRVPVRLDELAHVKQRVAQSVHYGSARCYQESGNNNWPRGNYHFLNAYRVLPSASHTSLLGSTAPPCRGNRHREERELAQVIE